MHRKTGLRNALQATVLTGLALGGGALALGASAHPASAATGPGVRCDFSGDGLPDSVTGIPGKTMDGKKGAGAIMVRYQFAGLEFPLMYSSGALASATGNHFGASVACGDFNGDGYSDLAIGAPGYDHNAGAVVVMYSDGTQLANSAVFTQDTTRAGYSVPGAKEDGDLFGWSLAAGDFNNDGEDDLAIGAPGEDVTTAGHAYQDFGVVIVLNGSGASGVTANGKMFDPTDTDSPWLLRYDATHYGWSLAVGDFDADSIADLAVGMPGAHVQDFHSHDVFHQAGAVHELRGHHHSGLAHHQFFWENLFYPNDNPYPGDLFGYALAAGDIDGNGRDDIAIGAPGDLDGQLIPPCGDPCEATAASRPGRLFTVKHTNDDSYIYSSYSQGDPGVPGEAEMEDSFGFSVAIGQFDGRLGEDIAVGAPGENDGIGAVTVFYSGGFREVLWQGSAGVAGVPEAGDWFGFSLATTDQDADGVDDLLVGAGHESVDGIAESGATNTLFGHNNAGGLDGGDVFDQSAPDGYQDLDPAATNHSWPIPIWWNPDTSYSGEMYGFAVTG
jgi:hypothetical protein